MKHTIPCLHLLPSTLRTLLTYGVHHAMQIIVSCLHAGMDMHKLVDSLLEFAHDCRFNGTAGRLRHVIGSWCGT